MNIFARLACLHREIADAYDELASEQKRKVRKVRRKPDSRAAAEAVRLVQEGLRRNGVRQ